MEVEFDKTLTDKWEKLPYWWGNPELKFECWGKKYKDSSKVYIFGKTDRHKEPHSITDFLFVVRNSHSEMFKKDSTSDELMNYVDLRYKLGLLSHGRNLTEKELQKL